ncbi:MAG: phosphatase PAP2 family protein [Candidatus Zixiibacteriota bacterium]
MKQVALPRYHAFDLLIAGYSVFMAALLLAVGQPIGSYLNEIIIYSGTALTAILIPRYVNGSRGGLHRFVRVLYPAVLFSLFYQLTGGTMFLFFDHFLDPGLTQFEHMVMGINSTLYIDQHLLNVWLNELFSFCYFCYYAMIPGFLWLCYAKRHDDIIQSFWTVAGLTFFPSYLLFFSFPIEGPRWFFADLFQHDVEGFIFRPLVNLVIDNGAVRGGCMPSTHVAIALVILIFCRRHFPRLYRPLLAVNVGLAIGTVWGRFHYISDVIVGTAIALAAFLVFDRLQVRTASADESYNYSVDPRTEHVA